LILLACSGVTAGAAPLALSDAERRHIQQLGAINFCVDPDWLPFEVIDSKGQHVGIAADLLTLVAQRTGLTLQLLKTMNWPDSLAASKAGRCRLLSLLNQTPVRDAWLIFTDPLLTDDNVLITREEHPFVVDLASLPDQIMALPKGTSIEERLRQEYPNIKIVVTDTEAEALQMVSDRKADMTMRALIVAAYTIKHEGWFNLKIAGQVPGYRNQLRIGIVNNDSVLRDILNKGVASITPVERQQIIDRHITITATTSIDYALVRQLLAVIVLILLTSLFWLRKINMAKRLAEQTADHQRQFIAMLSHEVRTPLAVIDASNQVLMLRLKADPESLPLLNRIRRGVTRLTYFFDSCLAADRVDTDNFVLQSVPIDVAQLVTWVAESATLLSPDHRIDLDVEPGLPALQGDQVLLRIMLMNLLSNAFKYSPPTTPVRLRVWRQTDGARLCCFAVEDQGPGIPADEMDLIFQRYQRGRAAQGTPGAGLGLSLVTRTAQLHGGSVKASSQLGEGSQFTVEIPFAS
jgi:polar amino acid transport system substrate-binding protein